MDVVAPGTGANRVYVDMVGDETSAAYKRRPIMTLAERVSVVSACRYVEEAGDRRASGGHPRGLIDLA
ncbi:hypothetical protein [Nocardioides sp.]|uniref:hypothetical protein n=1 Tax=Nocardioides sp. TaxID=35761 RepID=UPI002605A9F9|nr:hypothetical protein [Nocardioides sp.]